MGGTAMPNRAHSEGVAHAFEYGFVPEAPWIPGAAMGMVARFLAPTIGALDGVRSAVEEPVAWFSREGEEAVRAPPAQCAAQTHPSGHPADYAERLDFMRR